MNKVKRRAVLILILAVVMALGLASLLLLLEDQGADWAAFPSNSHVYREGMLIAGRVRDSHGELLLATKDGERVYSADRRTRLATLHATGDPWGMIGGSAIDLFSKHLMGYSLVNGVYSLSGQGRDVYLSVDAELNRKAWDALNGRSGCVAVINYQTGELICMVSSPSFDPQNPPEHPDYLNRFLTGLYTPGSIFKLVTSFAALEELPQLADYRYTCSGAADYEDGRITCEQAHGELSFDDALAVSCNCCFADLAQRLGGATLEKYAQKAGLMEPLIINGFTTVSGGMAAPQSGADLGWAAAGQYHDQICPAAMLRFVAAIANGGKAENPWLLKKVTTSGGIPLRFHLGNESRRLMSGDTAAALKEMMAYNVRANYGVDNFPGLPVCAKSGTAEVEVGRAPHAWFTGFLNSDEHPYAFIVLVENGGTGKTVAGSIANTVLQAAVAAD
ncbi:MAG: penicillin-binding protein [Clostridia bacterium]|nr:penicillin-binding protein [Clostridia bacterium]